MANLKNVIYLSNEDYDTLVSTGTVTIDGDTLTYDENNVYVTPDKLVTTTEDGLMSCTDKVILDTINSAYIKSASVSGHTLTLTKQDGSTVTFDASTDNQRIKVGSTTFGADDEINLVGGTNITLTPATTGDGAPKITIDGPAVGNATISFEVNDTEVDSFTTNASTNKTIDFYTLTLDNTGGEEEIYDYENGETLYPVTRDTNQIITSFKTIDTDDGNLFGYNNGSQSQLEFINSDIANLDGYTAQLGLYDGSSNDSFRINFRDENNGKDYTLDIGTDGLSFDVGHDDSGYRFDIINQVITANETGIRLYCPIITNNPFKPAINNATYGIVLPNTTSWTANRTFATTDDITITGIQLNGTTVSPTNKVVNLTNVAKTNVDNNFSTNQTFKQPIKFESSTSGSGTLLDANNINGSFSFKTYYNTSISGEIFGYNYNTGVIHFEDGAAGGYLALPKVGTSSSAVTLATVNDISNHTVTITQNDEYVDEFNLNQQYDMTIDIQTPRILDLRH